MCSSAFWVLEMDGPLRPPISNTLRALVSFVVALFCGFFPEVRTRTLDVFQCLLGAGNGWSAPSTHFQHPKGTGFFCGCSVLWVLPRGEDSDSGCVPVPFGCWKWMVRSEHPFPTP